MRGRLGIPMALGSCHTARVAGYALEGHVPAADVKRLLDAIFRKAELPDDVKKSNAA